MKILFVIPRIFSGGATKHTYEMAVLLRQSGHDVSFFIEYAEGPFLKKIHKIFKVYNVFLPQIFKFFNIIHFVNDNRIYQRLVKQPGQKFYETVHCQIEKQFIPNPKMQLDKIMCVTNSIRNILIKNGVGKDKCIVINNAVDWSLIDSSQPKNRKKWKISDNDKIFITVSRLSQEKGIRQLVESFRLLPPNVKLIVVGDGPLKQSLNKISSRNVIFTGYVENVYPLLKCADAFVLNSRTEGMPYCILEAVGCNLPIISTNVGEISQALNGCYAEIPLSISVQNLAKMLNYFIHKKISVNLKEIYAEVKNKFNYDRFKKDVLFFFKEDWRC